MTDAKQSAGRDNRALTIKQEKFCFAFIETGNASESYRRSYDCENMKPETINRKAKELMDHGKISARIAELRAEVTNKHKITIDDLISELEQARGVAMTANTPQVGAMVRATMGKAALLGFLKGDAGGEEDIPAPVSVHVDIEDASAQDAQAE